MTTLSFTLAPRVTAPFGSIDSVHKTPHTGIDYAMPIGSKVYAPEGGIVSRVVDYGNESLGKAVFVKTRAGYQYIFGHLSDNTIVREGDRVHAGDLIALSGSTGFSTGPHLHLGLINKAGAFVDPAQGTDRGHLGILGKILEKSYNQATDNMQEHARSVVYETAIGFLKGVGDLLLDLSYTIALIGGGLCIILHVAGWEKGARWAGILAVAYVLIKFIAAGA
ncbi:M23 family metallopeptidase [Paenibacillus planticolens]|uniref:Peptidoglycan DD-metalloendopeptidase family protein n=1 Tax=Paenibacillus planticolens TaxID=2654976 RepID=A0ABX1ZE83_9BACL|nr:M23 family metallopeptidase [Paenibacillus planticolens]NOU98415.1 peptidoglycan DD-metalloendopeptidase family protein [Paenibacillus planticolens]